MQEQTRPRNILIGAEHCIYVRCGMSSLKCVEHNPDYTLAYKLKILWTLAAICESTCGSQENKLLPSCKISSGLLSYGHSLHGHLVDITAKPSNHMGSALTQCQSWKPKRMLTALTGNDSDLDLILEMCFEWSHSQWLNADFVCCSSYNLNQPQAFNLLGAPVGQLLVH